VTPHILLLTSLAGDRYLITIHSIATIDPQSDGTTLIHDINGVAYGAKESFDAIMGALGGLVMKPFVRTVMPKDLQ
jgi:hypothetical protein